MAINKRVMKKIEEFANGDSALLGFLRALITYEAEGSGRYKKEYEDMLKTYAEKEGEK